MANSLMDKRFGLGMGLVILPPGAKPMYAGPHYYGKLKYEDVVQVQDIADKYSAVVQEAMRPMIDELKQLGFLQATEVAEQRKVAGKS